MIELTNKIIVNIILMIFLLLIFITGLIFIFSSESFAKDIAHRLAYPISSRLHPRPWLYESFYYEYTYRFITLGIVFSLISGIGIIFNTYILYKKITKS